MGGARNVSYCPQEVTILAQARWGRAVGFEMEQRGAMKRQLLLSACLTPQLSPGCPKIAPSQAMLPTTCSRLPITFHSTGLPWGRRENPYHLPQHAILPCLTQSSPAHVAFRVLCSLRLEALSFPPSPARPISCQAPPSACLQPTHRPVTMTVVPRLPQYSQRRALVPSSLILEYPCLALLPQLPAVPALPCPPHTLVAHPHTSCKPPSRHSGCHQLSFRHSM